MSGFVVLVDSAHNPVDVTDGHLHVQAFIESERDHISEHDALAFTWTIVPADFSAAETLLLVENDSDDLILHIDTAEFSADVASRYQIHVIDATSALSGGTEVLGTSENRVAFKSPAGRANARSNETGNSTQGTILWDQNIVADTLKLVPLGGLQLKKAQAVGVDIVAAPTSLAYCTIKGHFKIPL